MSRIDTLVCAEAWAGLVADLVDLGPNPEQSEVIRVVAQRVWDTEGITLDEDNR